MTAQPAEPDPRPAEVLHVVPDIPGQEVPPGVVIVPVEDYERIRRRAIAQKIRERTGRIDAGDFSDFVEVTDEEIAAGRLNAS
ncbi:MAG TPA: hypothetical protein VH912_02280 [Streptosporangiaceae bacterium]|jgi:hypothetical protein